MKLQFYVSIVILIAIVSCGVPNTQANQSKITNNYVISKDRIPASYGSIPKKGESRIDPITGSKITRLTDAQELAESKDALIVYSRYSPENTNGELFLVHGRNSSSSWVFERKTLKLVNALSHSDGKSIGEVNEIRWDSSGDYPYRIYYVKGMALYKIDDVRKTNLKSELIKDFSLIVPNAKKIYNDVEGNSSDDNNRWAWMAVHYDGTTNIVDAFISYEISTDKTYLLKAEDLANSELSHYSEKNLPRPNMVEISPNGSGLVLHYARAWGDKNYGSRPEDIGTWFDGPHIWPLDFDYANKEPIKISIDATHSGWAFEKDSLEELFVSQNNRTDKFDAVSIVQGFEKRIEIARHKDFGWGTGFHYAKMPRNRSGWILVSSYSKSSSDEGWGRNQLLMIQLKELEQQPIIWRIGHSYNKYTGDYRSEAAAAINTQGNRIYLSANWGGKLDHLEVFLIELPDDWNKQLEKLKN